MRRRNPLLPVMNEASPVGAGVPDIPFDQTAMEVPVPPERTPNGMLPTGPEQTGMPQMPAEGGDILSGLGEMGGQSDQIPTEELAGMVGTDPEAAQAEEIMAALQDPNTPPEVKQQIETMIATAARRRLAGVVS